MTLKFFLNYIVNSSEVHQDDIDVIKRHFSLVTIAFGERNSTYYLLKTLLNSMEDDDEPYCLEYIKDFCKFMLERK